MCHYCARLAAVETAELLALDALEGVAPSLWCVLTTRDAVIDPRAFWKSRERVWAAVRRRWPLAEYAALVEFTTGYGPLSGGLRRPHWNLLVKGVPREDGDRLREVVTGIWCRRENAEPWAQYVGEVAEVGGLMRYLALHFLKESQAPPAEWAGTGFRRFLRSQGYLGQPTIQARAAARRSLRLKRLIWKGFDAETAELELALQESVAWSLVHVNPSTVKPLALRRGEGGV